METVDRKYNFAFFCLMIFFIRVGCQSLFAFGEFTEKLHNDERVVFTHSLKSMDIDELEKIIKDNIACKAKAEYSFIIIDELFARNNEQSYAVIEGFLKRPRTEISRLEFSPEVNFWLSLAIMRNTARGDKDQLVKLFSAELKNGFNFGYLWELANLRIPEAFRILKDINAIEPNEIKGKNAALIINEHGTLPPKEFVDLIIDKVKNKITNRETDFSLEEWVLTIYTVGGNPKNLYFNSKVFRVLGEYLQKHLIDEQTKQSPNKIYLEFIEKAIKRQKNIWGGQRSFDEKVAYFARNQTAQKLIADLQNEYKNGTIDNYFHSPLHHLINNCAIEKVTEAIPLLFSLVDFTLDPTTDYEHPKNSRVDFFPAAKAIATLRPPASVILQAMQAIVPPNKSANNEPENATNAKKRLQLLTWILYQIEENDAELAKFILQRKINNNEDKNGSLVQALKLLEKPDELLPTAF